MKDNPERYIDRLEADEWVVRLFLALGVAFWGMAALAALRSGVFAPLVVLTVFVLAVLALGWYFERAAAAITIAAAAAVVAWGITAGWATGVWIMMSMFLIVPLLAVGGMFLFARHEEKEVAIHGGNTLPAH